MTNEELVKAIREGDAQPVELWQKLKPFIRTIAKRFQGLAEEEDLLQESYFGLLSAIRLYRPDDGSFANYAYFWIKSRMHNYVNNCVRVVRIPTNTAMMVTRLNRVVSVFQRDHSRQPSDEELCEALTITEEQLAAIRAAKVMSAVGSLDVPVSDDQDSDTLTELIQDKTVDVEAEVLEQVQQEQLSDTLWKLVDDHLTEQQAATIRGRFKEGKTQRDIAAALGVTGSRVHTIECEALRKLRQHRIRKQLEPYLDDIRYSFGLSGGLSSFRRSGESSTEVAAITSLKRYEKIKKELGL